MSLCVSVCNGACHWMVPAGLLNVRDGRNTRSDADAPKF